MSDVEYEAAGPDVTPPLLGCEQYGFPPAMGKRARDGHPPAGSDGGGWDDVMHDRIKRLNLGREASQPRMVWHGSAEMSHIASAVASHAAGAGQPLARAPSFDAQAERELLDNTYTCVNRLLGNLHEERQSRRRRRHPHAGMEEEDSGDEDL